MSDRLEYHFQLNAFTHFQCERPNKKWSISTSAPWIGLILAACDQFWSTRRVPEPGRDIDRKQRENRTRGGAGGDGGPQRRCSGESAVKPNKCHQWKSVFINVWMQNGALSSGPLINCLRRGRASPRDSSLSAAAAVERPFLSTPPHLPFICDKLLQQRLASRRPAAHKRTHHHLLCDAQGTN
jgi:hypothetical protein